MLALPYVVVDQNVLRKEAELLPAFGRAIAVDGAILLPDVAMVEMTKGVNWESATRQSLRIMSRFPDRVVVAHGVGELLRRERDAGRPVIDLVDREVTESFRRLLRDLQGGAGPTLEGLLQAVPSHQQMAADQHLDHSKNKPSIERIVEQWKCIVTPEGRRHMAEGNVDLFRELLALDKTTEIIEGSLVGAGYPAEAAKILATSRSVTAHAFLCRAALGLRWFVMGGIESAKGTTITNDVVDMDYVIMGSFCAELLSKETKVREMHDHLLAVAALRAAGGVTLPKR